MIGWHKQCSKKSSFTSMNIAPARCVPTVFLLIIFIGNLLGDQAVDLGERKMDITSYWLP